MSDTNRHGAGTYQMLWDCKFCGTQKLLGVTHRHCPNCGAAQDPERRYFPAEADMVALENHQYVGADRLCPACRQPNSAASKFCSECGADLATGQVVATEATRDIGTDRAESDTRRDVEKEKYDAEMKRVGVLKDGRASFLGLKKRNWIIAGVVALIALCVVTAVFALTYRKSAAGRVDALRWERTIQIESFQQVPGSGWDDSVPGDSYGKSCERRERSTKRVASGSHEECHDVDQGDGSMERVCDTVTDYDEEPVYDNWCSYTVDRWRPVREVKSGSEGTTSDPFWPEYALASGSGVKGYGQERAGSQDENYVIVIRDDDGKAHECSYDDRATWDQYRVEMRVELKLRVSGDPDCDTLKRATG